MDGPLFFKGRGGGVGNFQNKKILHSKNYWKQSSKGRHRKKIEQVSTTSKLIAQSINHQKRSCLT